MKYWIAAGVGVLFIVLISVIVFNPYKSAYHYTMCGKYIDLRGNNIDIKPDIIIWSRRGSLTSYPYKVIDEKDNVLTISTSSWTGTFEIKNGLNTNINGEKVEWIRYGNNDTHSIGTGMGRAGR